MTLQKMTTYIFLALVFLSITPSGYSEVAEKAEIRVIEGDFGRAATFKKPFRRVVSLAPSVTENIYALGAQDFLVGVSEYCDYPAEAKEKPKVGDIVHPNLEVILTLEPDLILSAGNAQQVLDKASGLGLSCLSFRSESIKDIKNDLHRLGFLLGKEAEAADLCKYMNETMEQVKSRRKEDDLDRKAVLAFDLAPFIVAGKRTLGDEILGLAGFENIAKQALGRYPNLSTEFVVEEAPDVFIYASNGTEKEAQQLRERWAQWKSIPAVANDAVYSVSADLVSRPSPRIMDGLLLIDALNGPRLAEE